MLHRKTLGVSTLLTLAFLLATNFWKAQNVTHLSSILAESPVEEEKKSLSPASNQAIAAEPVVDPQTTEPVESNGGTEPKDLPKTTCLETTREGATNKVCFPSVLVAGVGKCGSSALYFKLAMHPGILAHKTKEYCPANDTEASLWNWLDGEMMAKFDANEIEAPRKMLMNGCIGWGAYPKVLEALVSYKKPKILLLVRDYADFAYSYYSYTCRLGFDEGCEKLESPNLKGPWKQNRSPDKFHELVTTAQRDGPNKHFSFLQNDTFVFAKKVKLMTKLASRDNLLVIKNEDLMLTPKATLRKVATFVGLDFAAFPEDAFTLVSNSNDRPSAKFNLLANASMAEKSQVMNSGSSVRDDTRKILNSFWWKECRWLNDTVGLHYENVC